MLDHQPYLLRDLYGTTQAFKRTPRESLRTPMRSSYDDGVNEIRQHSADL